MDKIECLLIGNVIDMYLNEEYIDGLRIAKGCVKLLSVHLGHDADIGML